MVKMFLQQTSWLTVLLVTTVVYFMWMDVALYVNLQKVPPLPTPPSATVATAANGSTVSVSPTPPPKVHDGTYSPFHPISVKQLMSGPTNHYIEESISYWTVSTTSLAEHVSADAVSFSGVFVALVGSYLLCRDSLFARQMGVVVFQFREYIDALDGWVAKERNKRLAFNVPDNSYGYYLDGYCDTAAFVIMYFGIAFHLYFVNALSSRTHQGLTYQPVLPMSSAKPDSKRRFLPYFLLCLTAGLQLVVSSVGWNLCLLGYNRLLETYSVAHTPAQLAQQNLALKSSTFWMVAYLWRFVNPAMLSQYALISVLYNKELDYLLAVHKLGYIPIMFTVVLSQVYYWVALGNIMAAGEVAAPQALVV